MRSGEGDVLEEWLTIGHGIVDLRDGVVGDGVREVEIRGFYVDQSVLEEQCFRVPEGVCRLDESEVFFEAALRWKWVCLIAGEPLVAEASIVSTADMPLAGH